MNPAESIPAAIAIPAALVLWGSWAALAWRDRQHGR